MLQGRPAEIRSFLRDARTIPCAPLTKPRRRPMVAQKGKDLLLKIDTTGHGFVTVAGLRSKRIAFNSETVDITDADSVGRWRELLAGSGMQRAAISGSGIFKDAQSDEA